MVEEVEPVYGHMRFALCPECKRRTHQRWIGYWKFYSQWECLACGRVILGEPYKKS